MILVTGGTGRTGQHVVDHLLAQGEKVRVLTRSVSHIPDRWDGVEPALGDLDDADALRAAMAGIDGLFVLAPMDPDLDRMERNAYEAASRCGVDYIVKMSTTKPDPESPIPWWRAHWRSEARLRDGAPSWTILRPNGITFFLLGHAESVREHGRFQTAGGGGRMALIDADDIGAVTAVLFADRERYAGAVLDLTGPAALSYNDVAAILTKVTGRTVTHEDIAPEEGLAALRSSGLPSWEAEGMVANWLMTRDGSGGFDRVTDVVERMTGRPPLDVEQFLRVHRAAFTPPA